MTDNALTQKPRNSGRPPLPWPQPATVDAAIARTIFEVQHPAVVWAGAGQAGGYRIEMYSQRNAALLASIRLEVLREVRRGIL